jgi:hypothetical protein
VDLAEGLAGRLSAFLRFPQRHEVTDAPILPPLRRQYCCSRQSKCVRQTRSSVGEAAPDRVATLVGSVKHAIEIEKKYKYEMPELSLSEAIGRESPYAPRGWTRWLAKLLVSHEKFRENGELHSDGKIELFYKSVLLVLGITTVILIWQGGIRI